MAIDALALGGLGLASNIYGAIQTSRAEKKAKKEQKKQIAQISEIYDKVIGMYAPGSKYGQSLKTEQAKNAEITMGKDTMRAIQSGLAGTTYGTQVAQRYETTQGRQARQTLEDYLMSKYTGALQSKAEFLGGINISGPQFADVANAYAGIGESLGQVLSNIPKKKKPETSQGTVPAVTEWSGITPYSFNSPTMYK